MLEDGLWRCLPPCDSTLGDPVCVDGAPAGWKPTGDEGFAPLVHEEWTDRIHRALLGTGPDGS